MIGLFTLIRAAAASGSCGTRLALLIAMYAGKLSIVRSFLSRRLREESVMGGLAYWWVCGYNTLLRQWNSSLPAGGIPSGCSVTINECSSKASCTRSAYELGAKG
jgi:hypothetical protein